MSRSHVAKVEPVRVDSWPGQGMNAMQATDRAGRRFIGKTEGEARQLAEDYNNGTTAAPAPKARQAQGKGGR